MTSAFDPEADVRLAVNRPIANRHIQRGQGIVRAVCFAFLEVVSCLPHGVGYMSEAEHTDANETGERVECCRLHLDREDTRDHLPATAPSFREGQMDVRYDRLILSMDDTELEQFCRSWVEKKSKYFEVKRDAGTGDLGRDVVGFLIDQRHEGDWDNYQCKQYRSGVALIQGLLAMGKVLYWAWHGEFTAPRKFFFVAPKGSRESWTAS